MEIKEKIRKSTLKNKEKKERKRSRKERARRISRETIPKTNLNKEGE